MKDFKDKIKRIGNQIRTQDNLCTHLPVFVIERRRTVVTDFPLSDDGCNIVWVDDEGAEATEETFRYLEDLYQNKESKDFYVLKEDEIPENVDAGEWERHGVAYYWEFVTACFTRESCDRYIRVNGHNIGKHRIFVYSGYRNSEWEDVRDLLQIQEESSHDEAIEALKSLLESPDLNLDELDPETRKRISVAQEIIHKYEKTLVALKR